MSEQTGGINVFCESGLCIFNRGLKCSICEVYINEQSICCNYTPVYINPKLLEAGKERQLHVILQGEDGL